jgi:quercetin dioxygenase-like cupin family protein
MRILELQKQGEALLFPQHVTAPDDVLMGGLRLAPGAKGPEPHAHMLQEETFTVTQGRLIVTIDGKEQVLEVGQSATVLQDQVHTFRNGHADQTMEASVRLEPALNFEWMLHEMATSAIRNGGEWKSLPMLEVGYMLHELRAEYRLAGIPLFIQRPLFALLHGLARLTGAADRIAKREAYYAVAVVPA